MYEYRCKVSRVVDGDTVDVDIDLGFGMVYKKQRVRMKGIDTPESRTRDLVEKNLDYIKEECNSTISTAASIISPQSPIVSRVAKEFKLKSIIGFGNTTLEKALKHKAMRMCKELDSELVILSESQGFNNVLYHNLNKLSEDKPMFKILFAACKEIAKDTSILSASLFIAGTIPDVLRVILLFESPYAF